MLAARRSLEIEHRSADSNLVSEKEKHSFAIVLAIGSGICCLVVAFWCWLVVGMRCDEGRCNPAVRDEWHDDPGAFQWIVIGVCGFAALAGAIVLLVVILNRRRGAAWLIVAVNGAACAVGVALIADFATVSFLDKLTAGAIVTGIAAAALSPRRRPTVAT